MIRVVLIDDEPPARRKLRHLLSNENEFEIVGEAGSGSDAVDLLRASKPDLAFLDIRLPDCSGFDVLEELGEPHRCQIVFVTAYDEFALQAFAVHAIDYLLKPIEPSRFRQSLARIRALVGAPDKLQNANAVAGASEALRHAPGYERRIVIREKGRTLFLQPQQIDWLEAARHYVCIGCGDGRTHVVRSGIEELAAKLDTKCFRRISRSQIVNVNRIAEVEALDHSDRKVILTTGKELRWSRRYRNGTGE